MTPTASFNTMGPVPEEGCETQAVTDVTLMRSTITEVGQRSTDQLYMFGDLSDLYKDTVLSKLIASANRSAQKSA